MGKRTKIIKFVAEKQVNSDRNHHIFESIVICKRNHIMKTYR